MILIILIDSCFDYWPNANTCGKGRTLKPKGDKVAVQASDRVAQVIANRRKEALELGFIARCG